MHTFTPNVFSYFITFFDIKFTFKRKLTLEIPHLNKYSRSCRSQAPKVKGKTKMRRITSVRSIYHPQEYRI